MRFTTVLTLVMLLIFTTMVLMASTYPRGARFMPFVVGIPGIVLCLLQLAVDFCHARRRPAAAALPGNGGGTEAPQAGTIRRELVMWSYFVGFIAGVLLFGFVATVPVMAIAFLRNEAKASWPMTLALGLGATLVLHLVFQVLMQIRLHAGFLTPELLRWAGF